MKLVATEVPPPVVVIVTLAVPGVAMSVFGTTAVHCVVPTYVVAKPVEFQVTAQDESKDAPLTVRVN